jgi:hypothetical protein
MLSGNGQEKEKIVTRQRKIGQFNNSDSSCLGQPLNEKDKPMRTIKLISICLFAVLISEDFHPASSYSEISTRFPSGSRM